MGPLWWERVGVVEFRNSAPKSSIDAQRSLRSERGTPRLRSHALSSNPCRTGWQGMCIADKQDKWQTGERRTPRLRQCTCRWEELI